jgi:hypothetical protein
MSCERLFLCRFCKPTFANLFANLLGGKREGGSPPNIVSWDRRTPIPSPLPTHPKSVTLHRHRLPEGVPGHGLGTQCHHRHRHQDGLKSTGTDFSAGHRRDVAGLDQGRSQKRGQLLMASWLARLSSVRRVPGPRFHVPLPSAPCFTHAPVGLRQRAVPSLRSALARSRDRCQFLPQPAPLWTSDPPRSLPSCLWAAGTVLGRRSLNPTSPPPAPTARTRPPFSSSFCPPPDPVIH